MRSVLETNPEGDLGDGLRCVTRITQIARGACQAPHPDLRRDRSADCLEQHLVEPPPADSLRTGDRGGTQVWIAEFGVDERQRRAHAPTDLLHAWQLGRLRHAE